jgi:RNA polymerase sigma factor (sigma-70 family)
LSEDPSVSTLVAAAQSGDSAAWSALVDRYAPLVWNVCWRYRLSQADAADVSQTVWLRLVERLDAVRDPEALAGWLVTTTRREALRVLAQARRQAPGGIAADLDIADDTEATEPARGLLTMERQEAVLAALAELSDPIRRLLLMLAADPPKPYSEISATLGIPIGSIGPTRMRGLERLRRSLAARGMVDVPAVAMTRGR